VLWSHSGAQTLLSLTSTAKLRRCRNELSKLEDLRYVPEMRDAKNFAELNRPRVVAWLVQVVTALGLTRETLHCAVSLLDRFIAGTQVGRDGALSVLTPLLFLKHPLMCMLM
jgi:hypothetical protein